MHPLEVERGLKATKSVRKGQRRRCLGPEAAWMKDQGLSSQIQRETPPRDRGKGDRKVVPADDGAARRLDLEVSRDSGNAGGRECRRFHAQASGADEQSRGI